MPAPRVAALLLAAALVRGQTVGTITCSSTKVTGSTSSATDTGYQPAKDVTYAVTLTESKRVTFSMCDSSFDTIVRVLDAVGSNSQTAYCDDAGGGGPMVASCTHCGGSSSNNENFVVDIPAGTHYLMVEGYGTSNGNYEIDVSCESYTHPPFAPPTPPFAPACALELDLVLVFDVSGSMQGQESGLKALGIELVDQFILGENLTEVGVVEFNTDATVLTRLNGDLSSVVSAINQLDTPSGGTSTYLTA